VNSIVSCRSKQAGAQSFHGLLFANRKGSPIGPRYVRKKVLDPVREGLGIPRGAFHAFRHGHATTMFSVGGANPKMVQDSIGHSDIKTTTRYTHAISNDRREPWSAPRKPLCGVLR
jgi:site-specific recombinase XerD